MARRYVRALDEKIKRVKEHVEMGTATEEEVAWLTKIDATIALYGKPYPNRSKIARRQRTINLNPGPDPGREKRQKRPKLGQHPDTPHIQRYHHPHSRRGI